MATAEPPGVCDVCGAVDRLETVPVVGYRMDLCGVCRRHVEGPPHA